LKEEAEKLERVRRRSGRDTTVAEARSRVQHIVGGRAKVSWVMYESLVNVREAAPVGGEAFLCDAAFRIDVFRSDDREVLISTSDEI
jgi:hypothetical protein